MLMVVTSRGAAILGHGGLVAQLRLEANVKRREWPWVCWPVGSPAPADTRKTPTSTGIRSLSAVLAQDWTRIPPPSWFRSPLFLTKIKGLVTTVELGCNDPLVTAALLGGDRARARLVSQHRPPTPACAPALHLYKTRPSAQEAAHVGVRSSPLRHFTLYSRPQHTLRRSKATGRRSS